MSPPYSLDIDRLSVCQRPSLKSGGSQSWRNLLFLHWSIPLDFARSLLPSGMEIDLYQGQALLGVVPFEMYRVRPSWLPKWMSFNFLETNVRLYVVVDGQPGVYFLSLEAASWLAVQAARLGWGLPYFYAKMNNASPSLSHMPLSVQDLKDYTGCTLSYSSFRRSGLLFPSASSASQNQKISETVMLDLRYQIGSTLPPSQLGSLEFFLLERYLLFVNRHGQIYQGQVYHTPYPAYKAHLLSIKQTLTQSHGFDCSTPPLYVHASPGVDVEVFDLIAL